jgi:hypothetical protein
MVVLPALSRPRTRIRASWLPNKEENILLNKRPIFFFLFLFFTLRKFLSACHELDRFRRFLFIPSTEALSLYFKQASNFQESSVQASEVSRVLWAMKMWFRAGQMGLWTGIVPWVSALIRIHTWIF